MEKKPQEVIRIKDFIVPLPPIKRQLTREVRRVGGSLMLVLPADIVDMFDIQPGQQMKFDIVSSDKITITPMQQCVDVKRLWRQENFMWTIVNGWYNKIKEEQVLSKDFDVKCGVPLSKLEKQGLLYDLLRAKKIVEKNNFFHVVDAETLWNQECHNNNATFEKDCYKISEEKK